jgi:hypothetical protein
LYNKKVDSEIKDEARDTFSKTRMKQFEKENSKTQFKKYGKPTKQNYKGG